MIEGARVVFEDGNMSVVERVNFKDGGWIGIFNGEAWSYYPPHEIDHVVSTD
jgi:hypothetical protein